MKKPSEWLGTAKKVSSDYKLSINNVSGATANCIKECVKRFFEKSTNPFHSLCGNKYFSLKSNVRGNIYIYHQSGIINER